MRSIASSNVSEVPSSPEIASDRLIIGRSKKKSFSPFVINDRPLLEIYKFSYNRTVDKPLKKIIERRIIIRIKIRRCLNQSVP